MLNRVVLDLNQTAGIQASFRQPPSSEVDAILDVVLEGNLYPLAIEARRRAPYPGELSALLAVRDRIEGWGTPTLVAPVIPESIGNQLVPFGWNWADEQGNYDFRLSGTVRLARRASSQKPLPKPRRGLLPQGRGGLAIIRRLISASHDVPLRTSDLASSAQVTNARASQVMHKLQDRDLVEKSDDGWIATGDDLLSAFITEYRGPGGMEFPLYSLDNLRDVAAEVVHRVERSSFGPSAVAISADVGPDLIVPWKRPSKLVAYVGHQANIDLTEFTRAPDRNSANLLLRFPEDRSVFRHHNLVRELGGVELPLADESQMIWDLHDLGGEDRAEAAQHLSEWLTRNR